MFTKLTSLLLTCVLVATTTVVKVTAWDCPTRAVDSICYCVDRDEIIWSSHSVHCVESTVTQKDIDNILQAVKEVNDFVNDNILATFYLRHTTGLETLDLLPFNDTRFKALFIEENTALKEIVGPTDLNLVFTDSSFLGVEPKVLVGLLKIQKVSQNVKSMYWTESNLDAHLDTPEFYEALSLLPNLEILWLFHNNIANLTNANFTALKNLRVLDLSYNDIVGWGPSGLQLPQSEADTLLTLTFQSNALTNDGISVDSGLSSLTQAETVLDLKYNDFEYISAENFEPFLNLNPNNVIQFYGNQIICDQRMKWLKDARDLYEHRVHSLDCTNDPGYNIFTTDLV